MFNEVYFTHSDIVHKHQGGREMHCKFNSSWMLVLVLTLFTAVGCGDDERQPINIGERSIQATHVVQRGDFLKNIAPRYQNVGWESILVANEGFLKAMYDQTCSRVPESRRNLPGRSGLFCNDRYNRPYGNTLMPGWKLAIPTADAPQEIVAVVQRTQGQKVALVIDDTGSMANDNRTVALYYDVALRDHGRDIVAVCLYADDEVRCVDEGNVGFRTVGEVENTWGALQAAADYNPDVIFLITDEEGDDWPRTWLFKSLPPVVATCLSDGGFQCEAALQELVAEFGGEYVSARNY
jgi:hypothetical protein